MRDLSAIGALGVVTVSTRGTTGTGEVLVSFRGGSESFLAWSDEPLPKGTKIMVVDVVAPRTVHVIPQSEAGLSHPVDF